MHRQIRAAVGRTGAPRDFVFLGAATARSFFFFDFFFFFFFFLFVKVFLLFSVKRDWGLHTAVYNS